MEHITVLPSTAAIIPTPCDLDQITAYPVCTERVKLVNLAILCPEHTIPL